MIHLSVMNHQIMEVTRSCSRFPCCNSSTPEFALLCLSKNPNAVSLDCTLLERSKLRPGSAETAAKTDRNIFFIFLKKKSIRKKVSNPFLFHHPEIVTLLSVVVF